MNSMQTPLSSRKENLLGTTQEKILIVDDDRLILHSLEETLKREGYQVLKALTGPEAIEIMNENSIALIICDQRMPGMSGIDVLKKARSIRPEAIRIILTGNMDLDTVVQAINIGQISQFIIKPWEDVLLRQTVAESIEKYTLLKENQNLHDLIIIQHKELSKTHETLRHELQVGARIHEALLLGKVPPHVPGFVIDATTIPSKEIDGDFFEFYRPTPQIMDVVLGDVMGKGIPAALVGTAVKTQLMRFAMPFIHAQIFDKNGHWQDDLLSPGEILAHVSEEITQQLIHLEYFVSLFYGRFNSLKRSFTYVDCGSTKPIHYKASQKKVFQLSGNSFPLGMVEKDKYTVVELPYAKDDLFVFYSDGVTEAKSPEDELYGVERLVQTVEQNPTASAENLLAIIKNQVLSFAKKDYFDDDLTIIVIKITNEEQPKEAQASIGKFSSELSQLKAVRNFVQKYCHKAPGNTEKLSQLLQLAINEVFCNIVKHGHRNLPNGTVIIQGELLEEGILFQISDRGEIFHPYEIPEPNLSGEKEGGFGWYIIKEIVDRIAYIHKESEAGWNHLQIYKRYFFDEEIMELSHRIQDQVLIVTPEGGSLDAKDAPTFKEKVVNLISNNDFQRVVFDLQNLHFIDSSGLGSFLSVLRILHTRGGELKLARMNKPIRTMFELVSMHKIFEIFNTTDDAVRSFNSHQP